MSPGSMTTTHALQQRLCRLLFHANVPSTHKHKCIHTHTSGRWDCNIQFCTASCMCGSIFRNKKRSAFLTRCVRSTARQKIQSDGPQLFAQSALQKGCVCRQRWERSRADPIVCTSKCTVQHQCAASLHIAPLQRATYHLQLID